MNIVTYEEFSGADDDHGHSYPWTLMNIVTYEDGWCGGKFLIDGTFFDTSRKPKAKLIIDGKKYKAIYEEFSGVDDDHGHSYPWTLMHIGILDGLLEQRFLSVAKLKNYEVAIEFKHPRGN